MNAPPIVRYIAEMVKNLDLKTEVEKMVLAVHMNEKELSREFHSGAFGMSDCIAQRRVVWEREFLTDFQSAYFAVFPGAWREYCQIHRLTGWRLHHLLAGEERVCREWCRYQDRTGPAGRVS